MSAAAAQFERIPGVSAGIYAQADFERVRTLVHGEAGIVLPPSKAMLVYSRLAPLVRETGACTFGRFIDEVERDPALRRRTIDALTTNHTAFYREAHHFEHFASQMRPDLVKRLQAGGSVRLWSSASSSGEEAWSLLFTMLGGDQIAGRALARTDLVLLGTDISTPILQRARAATYPAETLDPVPAPLRTAWTRQTGSEVTIAPEVQALARFRALNLLGDWPIRKPFDAIFCRNVMIYFDGPTKERLVERLARQLVPGGYLYLGHSERASGPAADLLQPAGNTIYRRVG